MRHRIAQHLPIPRQQRIHGQEIGHRRHLLVKHDILPPRPRRPVQRGVEHQQAEQSEHENRQRMPGQTHHADRVIHLGALLHRGQHAQRHADERRQQDRHRGKLHRGGKEALDVLPHRMARHHGTPEIAARELAEIDPELDIQRPVEPEFEPHRRHHIGRRPVAHDGQHRIDRHHPPDQERDQHEAEQGDRHAGGGGRQRLEAFQENAPLNSSPPDRTSSARSTARA